MPLAFFKARGSCRVRYDAEPMIKEQVPKSVGVLHDQQTLVHTALNHWHLLLWGFKDNSRCIRRLSNN